MRAAAALAAATLSTFGYGNARLGSDPARTTISPANAGALHVAWRTPLRSAINTQPLVVGARVLVGTEHGAVVALDAGSGRVLWRTGLGHRRLPGNGCEVSPDDSWGITGTLVADRTRVYAVDGDGRAWALSLRTGRPQAGWPVTVAAGSAYVWGALAISRGRLYVPISSVCDIGRYYGGVAAIDLRHPKRPAYWRTTAGTKAFGGGIWGWGGISIDGRTGELYAATGNSGGTPREDGGHAESVVKLTAGLRLEQADDPLRPPFAFADRDFGTTPVLIDAPGCPAQLVAINKDGELFLYDRARIDSGPVQRLRIADDSGAYVPLYGMPAYEPASRTLILTSPTRPPSGPYRAGVQAFTLTSGCRLALRWQQRFDHPDAGSAPTIAGGVVYIAAGHDGFVRGVRLTDGEAVFSRRFPATIFAAPAVAGDQLLVAGWDGSVWALRPGRPAAARAARATR